MPDHASRHQVGGIAAVLASLRRAPRRVGRQSRELIETAVSQLFDAATRDPLAISISGEYRIDDLAQRAGTTTRNIRVYRDRGLLPPPLRVGRIALYNDTHLTRLRLITSMLDRGYTMAHVAEMVSAWENGKSLADILGLESALIGTWAAEKPESRPLAEVERLVDDDAAFNRLVSLDLVKVDGAYATVMRPKLLDAFNEIRNYGIDIGQLIDVHEQVAPLVDQISEILVRTGADYVLALIKPGEALPKDAEVAQLITMLVRFRTQAVASVAATLASSIESTIENLVSRLLADFIDRTHDSQAM
jgi:DNA-binding transcriptional MerR regulator